MALYLLCRLRYISPTLTKISNPGRNPQLWSNINSIRLLVGITNVYVYFSGCFMSLSVTFGSFRFLTVPCGSFRFLSVPCGSFRFLTVPFGSFRCSFRFLSVPYGSFRFLPVPFGSFRYLVTPDYFYPKRRLF